MSGYFTREDVTFDSNGTGCSAWLYLPSGAQKQPVVVMAHGLGGVRELWLDRYAEQFAAAGYACFLFDYRNSGSSGGKKRQLVSVRDQLRDWNNAVDHIKRDRRVDGRRLILFGASLGGGHVITLSAHRKDVTAAVAQCPYTSRWAAVKAVPFGSAVKLIPFVFGDLLSCLAGYRPVMLKLAAPRGQTALMTLPDYNRIQNHIPKGSTFRNKTPARTVLEILRYSPGRYAKRSNNPILVALCLKDTVAPAAATMGCVGDAKNITIKAFDCGHFDLYFGPLFEAACPVYLTFFDHMAR